MAMTMIGVMLLAFLIALVALVLVTVMYWRHTAAIAAITLPLPLAEAVRDSIQAEVCVGKACAYLDSGKISPKAMQASLEKVHAAQAEWHAELVNLREVVAAMPFPEQQLDLQAAWLRIEHRERLLEALRQELHTRLNRDRS